jgi:ketosteroid isomerase-like protein
MLATLTRLRGDGEVKPIGIILCQQRSRSNGAPTSSGTWVNKHSADALAGAAWHHGSQVGGTEYPRQAKPLRAAGRETDMPPDLEENRRLVRRYFELLNGSDLSRVAEIVSPDIVFFGPRAPAGIRGREAFIEFIAALRRDSPDLRFAEGEMVVEGDRVASVFTMTRTHSSSEEAHAKVIVTEGMDLFHIAEGRIQRINAYLDRLSMMVEMGLVSPPAQM